MDTEKRFVLNDSQQARLLACRAAWEEGEDEERLERLRLREEDAETVRAFGQILAEVHFAEGMDLTYAQMATLLALARALAPNPNLDARLLRRSGEPDALNHDLRELLYGQGAMPLRLRAFLSRRHTGGQTALQLLCAAQPERWPLITRAGMHELQLLPEQQQHARQAARERFHLPAEIVGIESYSNSPVHVGVPDNDVVLRLLADVIVYETVCETLEATDYLAVHRLLTRGMALKSTPLRPRRGDGTWRRGRTGEWERTEQILPDPPPVLVREPQRPEYKGHVPDQETASADPGMEAPPPVDLTGVTQKELLTLLEQEIAAQGFVYPPLIVRDYYLCLQSKPFVLLSGLSGTGKTRLTSLFAASLTGVPLASARSQYRLLPVRPDWTDSAPIVGYVNLLATTPQGRGTFVSTPFLEFMQRAARPENSDRAFFLCLDEMNLARVEHYFAEILSAMETSTRELLLPDGRLLCLPANLFISGTLNQDEATHSLSRKVLDRANTLSFQEVDLREAIHMPGEELSQQSALSASEAVMSPAIRQALFLRARVGSVGEARQKLQQISPTGADFAVQVVNVLADINGILEPHGLHFAYRLRDEALRYCANSFDGNGDGLLAPDASHDTARNLRIALDLQLQQKVLPRLSGTQDQLEIPLAELLRYVERHPFAQTTRRLRRLQSRLERDGFAGFDTV